MEELSKGVMAQPGGGQVGGGGGGARLGADATPSDWANHQVFAGMRMTECTDTQRITGQACMTKYTDTQRIRAGIHD